MADQRSGGSAQTPVTASGKKKDPNFPRNPDPRIVNYIAETFHPAPTKEDERAARAKRQREFREVSDRFS